MCAGLHSEERKERQEVSSENKVAAFIQDWWHFLVFLAGAVLSFWLGSKKAQWQLQQAIRDVDYLRQRVEGLETRQQQEISAMARVETQIAAVSQNQMRILDAIQALQQGKQDK